MKKPSYPAPLEHDEQVAVVQWCRAQYGLKSIFSIPNYARTNVQTHKYLLAEGKSPGVPDLFIPKPMGEYGGLFIEMKRRVGGKVSEDQDDWIIELCNNGYKVSVCSGFDLAKEAIEEYMKLGRKDAK